MKTLANVYESADMYGDRDRTLTKPMDGSAAIAVVELPEGYEIGRGNDEMVHVYGPEGTVYELDAMEHGPAGRAESYLCHIAACGDEYDRQYIRLDAMTLKKLRTRAGLTQVELAERVGVGQSQIADWERGRNVPSVQSCVKLALALGVDAGVVVASAMQSDR